MHYKSDMYVHLIIRARIVHICVMELTRTDSDRHCSRYKYCVHVRVYERDINIGNGAVHGEGGGLGCVREEGE